MSVNAESWDRLSLTRRHIVAWVDEDRPTAEIVAQLAAVPDARVYGRTNAAFRDEGEGGEAGPGSTTTTVPEPTTTVPEPTTTTTVPAPDPDPVVWPEEEGDPEPELGDSLDGDTGTPPPDDWWTERPTEGYCKHGGWAANYPQGLWKNQGDCVRFYATRGSNPPNGPAAHLYPQPPLDWHPSDG